jgi:hypothetical protein
MRDNRLAGHSLPCEGRVQLGGHIIGDGSGEGRAVCECGTESELLPSTRARQQWHRAHKNDIRSEIGLDLMDRAEKDED